MDDIIGHELAKQKLLSNTHVQSWMICGKRGIGKASLARTFAQYLVLNRDKNILHDYNDNNLYSNILNVCSINGSIGVNEIRNVKKFLYLSAFKLVRKVVIIDSIDDLTVNAANSMLKILEEPPKDSTIILISHSPYSVSQVIRSRCFILNLFPLNYDQTKQVIEKNFPDIHLNDDMMMLYLGSPGMVTGKINDEIDFYKSCLSILQNINNSIQNETNMITNLDLDLYKMGYILNFLISNIIKEIIGLKKHLDTSFVQPKTVNYWMDKYMRIDYLIKSAKDLHLDKRHVVLSLIHTLQ